MDVKEFMDFVEKSIELDEWVTHTGFSNYSKELKKETIELNEAIEKKDYKHAMEELGDILYDWMHTVKLAERDGHFTVEELLEFTLKKFNKRKPYIKENRKVSKEESVKIWYDIKKEENAEK